MDYRQLGQLPPALLDLIDCGIVVCDGQGLIRLANQAARAELAAAQVLLRVDGALRRAPGATGEIDAALREAARRRRQSLVRLVAREDGQELAVAVQPLDLPGEGPGHVLVMLGRRQPCSALALELLGDGFGLTPAGRRVLEALMREATPCEIAREHGIAMSTVRTQITAVRTKLGTRRMEGLLLRAARMPPLAGAARPAPAERALAEAEARAQRPQAGVLEAAPV